VVVTLTIEGEALTIHTTPAVLAVLSSWTIWNSKSDISGTIGDILTVAKVNNMGAAVKVEISTATKV